MDELKNDILDLLKQTASILNQQGYSVGRLKVRTDNKYSTPTLTNFLHLKTVNPNMETWIDMCNAAGITVRLETEQSRGAEISDSIAEYRVQLEEAQREAADYKKQFEDRGEKITALLETNARITDALIESNARVNALGAKLGYWPAQKENKEEERK